MNEPERAPEYLLSLQDELDAMGRFPPTVVPAVLLLALGGILFAAGLLGVIVGDPVAAAPWIIVGGLLATPGVLLGIRAREWYRRQRSLERGIALFDARQLKRAEEE